MIQENDRAPNTKRNDQAPPDRRPPWTKVFNTPGGTTIEECAQQRDTKRDERGQEGFHKYPSGHVPGQPDIPLIQGDQQRARQPGGQKGLPHHSGLADKPEACRKGLPEG